MSDLTNVSAPLAANLAAALTDLLSRSSVGDNEKYAPLLQHIVDENALREQNNAYVKAAQAFDIVIDGELEVDDTAQVSISKDDDSPGAYVQAWLYVNENELLVTEDIT
jgi:hypothetical protein